MAVTIVKRPVLWAFYRKGDVLVQCIDVTANGVPTFEDAMSYRQFAVSQVAFARDWTRIMPAKDEPS
jgi:ABC-type taurine transport system substrate-binding protein